MARKGGKELSRSRFTHEREFVNFYRKLIRVTGDENINFQISFFFNLFLSIGTSKAAKLFLKIKLEKFCNVWKTTTISFVSQSNKAAASIRIETRRLCLN